jgi:hypothetical protein
MIKDTDIVFITTTQYTKWLEYSRDSIKKHFPDSRIVHINGKYGWPETWFVWLDYLHVQQEKYFVLVDEDCFVLDGEGIKIAIEQLDETGAVLAGVPDAGFALRDFNSVALNPFFMIGNRLKLLNVLQRFPQWRQFRFSDKYKAAGSIVPHPNYEIFYGLFWAVLEAGGKFNYLTPIDDYHFADSQRQNPATMVRITPTSRDLALHMWYSRKSDEVGHKERYEKAVSYLKADRPSNS